jgi:hypothetical protein
MEQSPTTHRQPCGDLSRPYAERIDVPITDEHLDRGWLAVASLLESQPFKLKLKLGGPPPTMQVASLRSKHGGEWAQSGQLICSPQNAKLGFEEPAFRVLVRPIGRA